MIQTPKTRSRRWLHLFAVLSAIIILSPLAWRYRPLNASERRLVGTWRSESGWINLRLGADRVASLGGGDADPVPYASWKASGNALYMTSLEPDPQVASLSWYRQILSWVRGKRHTTEGVLIEFDDPDSVHPTKVKWHSTEEWTRVEE